MDSSNASDKVITRAEAVAIVAPFVHKLVRPRHHVQSHWFEFPAGDSEVFYFRKRHVAVRKDLGCRPRTRPAIVLCLRVAFGKGIQLFRLGDRRTRAVLGLGHEDKPYVFLMSRSVMDTTEVRQPAAPDLLLSLYLRRYGERDPETEAALLDACIDGTGLPLELLSEDERVYRWAERRNEEKELVRGLATALGVEMKSSGNWWRLRHRGREKFLQGLWHVYEWLLQVKAGTV